MLPPLGGESHTFEPTPQDIIAIQQCDVFIYVGGESETWVDEILADLDFFSPKYCFTFYCMLELI